VSVLEAERLGVPVVMAPCDALGDLWGPSGCRMMPGAIAEHTGEFVDAVCEVLTDSGLAIRMSEEQKQYSARFTFDAAASVLDRIIQTHIHVARERQVAA
jgi:glycosyltransferase involved in cell wall biosynthesis